MNDTIPHLTQQPKLHVEFKVPTKVPHTLRASPTKVLLGLSIYRTTCQTSCARQMCSIRHLSYWVMGGLGVGLRDVSHKVPSLKSLEVNPCNLSHLEHGKSGLPLHMGSQVWHKCLHGNTVGRWGLGLVLWVGSRKKLGEILNTSLANILHWIIKIQLWWYLTTFSWFLEAQKLGLCLHVGSCQIEWDLELGTPCEPVLSRESVVSCV